MQLAMIGDRIINYDKLGPAFLDRGTFFGDGVYEVVVAYGGCPLINDFDVLEPTGTATLEMTYNGAGSATSGAVIGQKTMNTAGFNVGVILSGFSYHYIRDDKPAGVLDRVIHLQKVLSFLGNTYSKTYAFGLDTFGGYPLE